MKSGFRLPIALGAVLIVLGTLLELLNWSFGDETRVAGFAILCFFYLLRFFGKTNKSLLDYVKLAIVVSWTSIVLLKMYYYAVPFYIHWFLYLALWLFGYLKIRTYSPTTDPSLKKQDKIRNGLFYVAAIFMVLGTLFKVMHWAMVQPLLILGMVLGGLWIVLELFQKPMIK